MKHVLYSAACTKLYMFTCNMTCLKECRRWLSARNCEPWKPLEVCGWLWTGLRPLIHANLHGEISENPSLCHWESSCSPFLFHYIITSTKYSNPSICDETQGWTHGENISLVPRQTSVHSMVKCLAFVVMRGGARNGKNETRIIISIIIIISSIIISTIITNNNNVIISTSTSTSW